MGVTDGANLLTKSLQIHAHTPNHVNCSACEEYRANTLLTAELPFNVASEIWLRSHSQYIKPSTARIYREHCKTLSSFFGSLPLKQFHVGNLRAYQEWRREKASPAVVNMEIRAVVIPILKEVEVWARVGGVYRTLPVPKKKVRKSMGEEEERRFLVVALDAAKPRRLLAGHCLVVMMNTSMGFGELKHLKREDVVLNEDIPYVTVNEGTKNDFRIRTIPLNWTALRSMRWILRRWESLGGTEPSQYILPHRASHLKDGPRRELPPDFRKPMAKIDRAAQMIFQEAGLKEFVPYDMRSCAITKILSDPNVSDQMAEEIIGHGDTVTKRRYSRQRLEKKAVAIQRLANEPDTYSHKLIAFPGGRK